MDYQAPPTTVTYTDTTVQNNINPSREESSRRALLLFIVRQFYAILVAFPGATLDERQLSMHVPEKIESRDFINSVRLQHIHKRIIEELSNMAEDKPEHMESLELAKSYVQQGTNREDVLSIVKSVWRS